MSEFKRDAETVRKLFTKLYKEGDISGTVLDHLARGSGLGSLSDAYSQMLRGVNHRGLGNPVRLNRDNSGIVFFTRPYLNLTYDNLTSRRVLTPLLTDNPYTLQRYIRAVLDPRSAFGSQSELADTPLVNKHNPFIPVLTNNLLSMSGWMDVAPETYTSKEGIMKESYSMIDGIDQINQQFDLTANFRNVEGDPITALFAAWIAYAVGVKLGMMYPYPDSIVNNRIDYNTRIYHLVLDPSRRFVTKVAATGASFPTTVPLGAAFNFVGDETYVQSTEQISIQFTCNGANYNDPILFEEFNRLVAMYNPSLRIESFDEFGNIKVRRQAKSPGDGGWFRLSGEEIKRGNYFGTPLIHPMTHELMWWVDEFEYMQMMGVSRSAMTDILRRNDGTPAPREPWGGFGT